MLDQMRSKFLFLLTYDGRFPAAKMDLRLQRTQLTLLTHKLSY